MKKTPYLLGTAGLVLALATVSCTTLGTHVKGGFACKAPQGTCAPMSNIDAQAIAGLGGSGGGGALPISGPMSGDDGGDRARFIQTGFGDGVPVRTGEHVIRVVFPAHTDGQGVFHDEAVAHIVDERARWAMREPTPPPPGSLDAAIAAQAASSAREGGAPVETSMAGPAPGISPMPQTLREAAAGLTAPAAIMPDHVDEQVATDMGGHDNVAGAAMPSAAALAAARAGHRIGDPVVAPAGGQAVHHAGLPDHRRPVRHGVAQATIAGAATAALNRAALHRLLQSNAPSTPDTAEQASAGGSGDHHVRLAAAQGSAPAGAKQDVAR